MHNPRSMCVRTSSDHDAKSGGVKGGSVLQSKCILRRNFTATMLKRHAKDLCWLHCLVHAVVDARSEKEVPNFPLPDHPGSVELAEEWRIYAA